MGRVNWTRGIHKTNWFKMAISIRWGMEKAAKPSNTPSVEMMRTMRHIVTFRLFEMCALCRFFIRVPASDTSSTFTQLSVRLLRFVCMYECAWCSLAGNRVTPNATSEYHAPSELMKSCGLWYGYRRIWHFHSNKFKSLCFRMNVHFGRTENWVLFLRNVVKRMPLPTTNRPNQCIRRMRRAHSKRRNVSLFCFIVGKIKIESPLVFIRKRAIKFSMLAWEGMRASESGRPHTVYLYCVRCTVY